MTDMWPLWECLSTKALVELAQYQWRLYDTKLDIIKGTEEYSERFFIESLDVIDKLMRQASRHQKRVS